MYYLGKNTPKEIVISHKLKDKSLLEKGLSTKIIHLPRVDKKHFLELATLNAKENLKQRLLLKFTKKKQLEAIQKILALKKVPVVMECFDISHTMGEATTASCVVFEKGSPKTSEYRQFNIKDVKLAHDRLEKGLNLGKIIWQVPFGEYEELTRNGVPITGTENYGGATGTAGNLIFATGTIDKKIRAFNSINGKEVWSYKLPFSGSGPPSIYSIDDEQYVIVASTGSHSLNIGYPNLIKFGNWLYCFKLKNN
mgnify:CR=1 FL=1